jgi:HEAT repeat protein
MSFTEASWRRSYAAQSIGELGPGAKSAVPALLEALKGKDAAVHEAAIKALGHIHSDPTARIPLLIGYLDDENLRDEAALALANYGSLAKAAAKAGVK